jgi:hypothetical protein
MGEPHAASSSVGDAPAATAFAALFFAARRPLPWEIVQDHLAPLDAARRTELAREQTAERDKT